MPKTEISTAPQRKGSMYTSVFNAPCADRIRQRPGDAGGLADVTACSDIDMMNASADGLFVHKDGEPYP